MPLANNLDFSKKLVIEIPSAHDYRVQEAFNSIPANLNCWQAKSIVYPWNQIWEHPLWFGGGAGHIWVCFKTDMQLCSDRETKKLIPMWQQNGAEMPDRVAVFFFKD